MYQQDIAYCIVSIIIIYYYYHSVAYLGFQKGGQSPSPFLPLELGEHCKTPAGSGVEPQLKLNLVHCISGGNNFNDFPENQLTKFHAV